MGGGGSSSLKFLPGGVKFLIGPTFGEGAGFRATWKPLCMHALHPCTILLADLEGGARGAPAPPPPYFCRHDFYFKIS